VRIKKEWIVLAAILVALAAPDASAVDFHGYFRSGIGGNSKGGSQICFADPGADYKFRLGNECENYAEWEFSQSLYKNKSGVEFIYDGMLAYVTPNASGDFFSIAVPPGQIALRQNWVGAKGIPFSAGGMYWVGKRYYHRNDVHQIDFFYWDVSGFGGGLDEVPVGPAKVSFALMQNSPSDDGSAAGPSKRRTIWRPDLRVTGIPLLFPSSSLEAGVSLYIDSSNGNASPTTNDSRQAVSPWFTVQWALTDFLGGFNKLAFQWGQGSASPLSQSPAQDADTSQKQWRIVEHMVYQPTDNISGALVFVYQDKTNVYKSSTFAGFSNKSLGVGIRPALQLNDYFKIEADIGYNSVTPKTGNTDSLGLFKLTVAPTITALPGPGGTYFTRPVLRAFLTYANWNTAAQNGGIVGQAAGCVASTTTSPFGCDTNGLSFGAQVEAWY